MDTVRTSAPDSAADIDRDLRLAERVYRSLLPNRFTTAGVDIVTRVQPYYRIGGDYATVFPVGDGRIFLCVSDATAHGVSSALLVTRVNSFVRERIPMAHHPYELVQELNAFLYQHFSGLGLFLSFFCGSVDLSRKEFVYAGCGHPPALHFRASAPDSVASLHSQHALLGMFPELSEERHMDTVWLEQGDRILLYTDGLSEARNAMDEPWESEGLIQAGRRCAAKNLEGQAFVDAVFAAAEEFQDGPSQDDALLMVVSIL